MRCCACCRLPAALAVVHPGQLDDLGVLVGLCRRCNQANDRLPAGTRQKRLNAAARLAASDTSGRYWTARFPNHGAAELAAHMLGHPDTAADIAVALGWEQSARIVYNLSHAARWG